jgi:hypothetical protein
MINLNTFKQKVIGKFSEQITDQVFLMIENDRELMNDYLHILCQHNSVHDVNGKIAKAVKENFGLENLSKRNKKPKSFLIQSFEQFKIGKKLLTILMLCWFVYGYAQTTPPHAASTQTWTFGKQTWSDAIQVPECNKADFIESESVPDCRSYTDLESGKTFYYYNWPYVDANKDKLCPGVWRRPVVATYDALVAHLSGLTQDAQEAFLSAWGLGGLFVGPILEHASGFPVVGWYWTTAVEAYQLDYAYGYAFGAQLHGHILTAKHIGMQVRCVK